MVILRVRRAASGAHHGPAVRRRNGRKLSRQGYLFIDRKFKVSIASCNLQNI